MHFKILILFNCVPAVELCACLLSQHNAVELCAGVLQSFLTLWDPVDWRPPGSSVHGIIQARLLERVAMPSSRGSYQPRDWTWSPALAGGFSDTSVVWETHCQITPLIKFYWFIFLQSFKSPFELHQYWIPPVLIFCLVFGGQQLVSNCFFKFYFPDYLYVWTSFNKYIDDLSFLCKLSLQSLYSFINTFLQRII